MDSELVATCDAIGTYDPNTREFILGKDHYYCLLDLLKSLRNDRDSNKFMFRRQMGNLNVVGTKLVPILKEHCIEKEELFDVVLRILVGLTNPTLLLFEEKRPDDKENNQLYLEMTMQLYQYKILFGSNLKVWAILAKHMGRILQLDWEKRLENHKLMLERILILVRNLLHVPLSPSLENNTSDEANPQDRLIELMDKSGVLELLNFMADSDEKEYCFHLLEIMSLMFRDQKADFLAKSYMNIKNTNQNGKRTEFEKDYDRNELKELVQHDRAKSYKKINYNSRFKEATYQLKNVKGVGENDVIVHKAPDDVTEVSLTVGQKKKKPKNLRGLTDDVYTADPDSTRFHKSTSKIRNILGKFCEEFLSSYNQVMKDVRYNLVRKQSQDNDETYYLWAFQFFMEFNRNFNKNVSLISETMTVDAFHYIHTLIQDYMDRLKIEKQKHNFVLWSRRMHTALKAYRELLLTIHFASNSDKFKDYDVAKRIKTQVFYENDYREMVILLLRDFIEKKMTRAFLRDLIETNHIFLNLLQKYCLSNKILGTKKKAKKATKKAKARKRKLKVTEEKWENCVSDINEALEGRVELPDAMENEDVLPVESSLDLDPEIQKTALMKRLRKLLIKEETSAAVALYRNAREAFSDDPEHPFGPPEITPAEEASSLKTIYMSDFIVVDDLYDDKVDEETENILETEVEPESQSSSMEFKDFVNKFCTPKIIQPYLLLFKQYEKNSDTTNICIVKMFHRIAVDCKMHALFFQASIFRVFQRVMQEPTSRYAELVRFSKFVVSKFVETLAKNENLLPEILFWKKCSEAAQLEDGFKEGDEIEDVDFVRQYASDEERGSSKSHDGDDNMLSDGDSLILTEDREEMLSNAQSAVSHRHVNEAEENNDIDVVYNEINNGVTGMPLTADWNELNLRANSEADHGELPNTNTNGLLMLPQKEDILESDINIDLSQINKTSELADIDIFNASELLKSDDEDEGGEEKRIELKSDYEEVEKEKQITEFSSSPIVKKNIKRRFISSDEESD